MKYWFLILMMACSHKEEIPVTPGVTFEINIKPITSTACVQCHFEGNNDFRIYENAYRARTEIYRRVYINRTMPAIGSLTEQQRALFRDWVDQGAQNETPKGNNN